MIVKDIDHIWRKILKSLRLLDEKAVKIGIQSGDMTADGKKNLAYIASIHEYGDERGIIPERSFIRSAWDENQHEINNFTNNLGGKITDGTVEPKQALDLIGLKVTGMIQEKITDGDFVPNAPATVRAKGSDKPLIDTGRLRASVRHVLEDP